MSATAATAATATAKAQTAVQAAVQAAFNVKPRRPYLQVKNELEKARALFQELYREHDEIRVKAQKYEKFREDKARARQAAVASGIIMADDDFNPTFAVPPRMTVPAALQEKFHRQHYIVQELADEEASYSSTEKAQAFIRSAAEAPADA